MARFLLVCVFVCFSFYLVYVKNEILKTISDLNEDDCDTMDYEEFLKIMDHKILNNELNNEILMTDKKLQETDGPMGPGGRRQTLPE